HILWAGAALSRVALAGARRIRVDADFLYYFTPGSEVRRANEMINREIIGSNPFYIVVEGGTPGVIRRWEVLKLIKDLQGFLGTLPGVTSSISIVDFLEALEAGVNAHSDDELVVDEQGNIVLSAKIGFFAILPNVVPIVIFFGVMGWLGVYLNLVTSLIAAIALGIAVDSTIHYMARLNLELRGESDQAAAIVRTVRTVGVPI